ncbi:hypothetical protein ACFOWB_07535 [Chenggangzhangella methanolivorans]|uniref:hypothetical protein n=1 Tax=Chenggangzhangella methanolivorans TaxID=1437009 RepID=UPI00360C1D31
MAEATRIAVVFALLASAGDASAAEREAIVGRDAYACASWAAWREYGQASLAPKGARASKACPIRIRVGRKVTVVEEDAGEGASEIRYGNKTWFVDSQRLD